MLTRKYKFNFPNGTVECTIAMTNFLEIIRPLFEQFFRSSVVVFYYAFQMITTHFLFLLIMK